MAYLEEITDYRAEIMKVLCSDREIVELLTDKKDRNIPDRNLMYTQIFPYAYTPETTQKATTYICFRLTVPRVDNKTYKNISITFYIFTHQSLVRTTDGLRFDLIGEAIDGLFNGKRGLGLGRVELNGMDDISPTKDYHGISLEYVVSEFNRPTINGKGR